MPDYLELAELKERIDKRVELGDGNPEVGHEDIDNIAEDVLRQIAAGHPDAKEMAELVVGLLDRESDQRWSRWYA